MSRDVERLVKQCKVCQYAKGTLQNTSLHTTLPIAHSPWVHLIMDFVLGLPKTSKGFDSILVVVDLFLKWHISFHELGLLMHLVQQIYLCGEVVRLHGVPSSTNIKRCEVHGTFLANFVEEDGNAAAIL